MTRGGTIGVIAGELARFTQFNVALFNEMTQAPTGTRQVWAMGVDVAGNCNEICRRRTGDFVLLMGDDHFWQPGLIRRLLAHDVDVIVPHCLKRNPPWMPVVFSHQDDDGNYVAAELPGPDDGIFEVHAAGSAGMLIRSYVLDALEDDTWFSPLPGDEGLAEDLAFCSRVREAGFRIWCDPGALLAHIAIHSVWPRYSDGSWHIGLLHDQETMLPVQRLEAVPA